MCTLHQSNSGDEIDKASAIAITTDVSYIQSQKERSVTTGDYGVGS